MFVRTAGDQDLAAVRELLVATWHATYDALYGYEWVTEITDDWHSLPALRARLGRPNSEFLVADDGARLGGIAYAAAANDPQLVMLHQLYVRPELHRAGIGGMLLREIEDSFPEARRIRLEVEPSNAGAIAFYRANGFVDAGATGHCGAPDSGLDALTMEKKLR